MFLFKDILEQLETAEASLISLTDRETGNIKPEKYNTVIGFLNTALSDIYTRFNLIRGECFIETTEGKYDYALKTENSKTLNPVNGFILDSAESPFIDTVLEVTGVMTINNMALPFNVLDQFDYNHLMQQQTFSAEECVRGFVTPRLGVLRTPVGLKDSVLKVKYKAGHTPIKLLTADELVSFDPESLVIDLPYPFLMAVVYYIVSRATSGRGNERMGNSIMNESGTQMSKYLAECKVIESKMSQTTETATPVDSFIMRGFV